MRREIYPILKFGWYRSHWQIFNRWQKFNRWHFFNGKFPIAGIFFKSLAKTLSPNWIAGNLIIFNCWLCRACFCNGPSAYVAASSPASFLPLPSYALLNLGSMFLTTTSFLAETSFLLVYFFPLPPFFFLPMVQRKITTELFFSWFSPKTVLL